VRNSELAIHLSNLASIPYPVADLFLFLVGKKKIRGRAVNPHPLPMSLTTLILRTTGKENSSDSDSDPPICKSELWIRIRILLGHLWPLKLLVFRKIGFYVEYFSILADA
jgi:hypothetical protein